MELTPAQKEQLEWLLTVATEQRSDLDKTLSAIEGITGDVDNLDELAGNGISAEDLMEVVNGE